MEKEKTTQQKSTGLWWTFNRNEPIQFSEIRIFRKYKKNTTWHCIHDNVKMLCFKCNPNGTTQTKRVQQYNKNSWKERKNKAEKANQLLQFKLVNYLSFTREKKYLGKLQKSNRTFYLNEKGWKRFGREGKITETIGTSATTITCNNIGKWASIPFLQICTHRKFTIIYKYGEDPVPITLEKMAELLNLPNNHPMKIEIDHIKGINIENPNHITNLQMMTRKAHQEKTKIDRKNRSKKEYEKTSIKIKIVKNRKIDRIKRTSFSKIF